MPYVDPDNGRIRLGFRPYKGWATTDSPGPGKHSHVEDSKKMHDREETKRHQSIEDAQRKLNRHGIHSLSKQELHHLGIRVGRTSGGTREGEQIRAQIRREEKRRKQRESGGKSLEQKTGGLIRWGNPKPAKPKKKGFLSW